MSCIQKIKDGLTAIEKVTMKRPAYVGVTDDIFDGAVFELGEFLPSSNMCFVFSVEGVLVMSHRHIELVCFAVNRGDVHLFDSELAIKQINAILKLWEKCPL